MLEFLRTTARTFGIDPERVARHIDDKGHPDDVRGDLEIAGLLSLLYRETGRLLALATDIPEIPACTYIAMPGAIDLPVENPNAAAHWELTWIEDRLSALAYDDAADQWLTGPAAAEQAVVAASRILTMTSTGTGTPVHAHPHSPEWDTATRALERAQILLEQARAGYTHTTLPGRGRSSSPPIPTRPPWPAGPSDT